MDIYGEIGANKWELEDALETTEAGTDAYVQAGLRFGDSDGWEINLYLENTKLAEVIKNSETDETEYSFSEETNNTLGIRFVNNFRDNISLTFGLTEDDFSGSSAFLGIRFRL